MARLGILLHLSADLAVASFGARWKLCWLLLASLSDSLYSVGSKRSHHRGLAYFASFYCCDKLVDSW